MEFKDLLSLYFERSNAMQMYWNFYITIILALIAFFGSVNLGSKTKHVASLLILAFVAFAVVNLQALREVDQQRIDARDLIESGSFTKESAPNQDTVSRLLKHLNPPTISELTTVRVISDVLVVGAILTLGWRKSKQAT